MILLLFGNIPMRIKEAVVITAYTIVDQKNVTVLGTSSLDEANRKLEQLKVRYPNSTFRII
jgi:hypothetical protein